MKTLFACLTIVGGLFCYAVAEGPKSAEQAGSPPAAIPPVVVPSVPRLPDGNATVLPPVPAPATVTAEPAKPEASAVSSEAAPSAEPALNTAQRGEIDGLLNSFVNSEQFDKTLDAKLATKVPLIVQEVAPGIIGPLVDQAVPGAVAKYMGEYKKEVSAASAAQMVQTLESRGIISRSSQVAPPSTAPATSQAAPQASISPSATTAVPGQTRIVERAVSVPTVSAPVAETYYPMPSAPTVISDGSNNIVYSQPGCTNPAGCSQPQYVPSYPQVQYSQPQQNSGGGGRGGIFGLGLIGRNR